MQADALLELMQQFRRAYAKGDGDSLKAVTSADFEWHQHYAKTADETPNGHTLKGIDALLSELAWRQEHWSDVTYADLEERAAGDSLLVQTFVISGNEDGKPFSAKAVDLYPVENGRITRKDTYWKYLK